MELIKWISTRPLFSIMLPLLALSGAIWNSNFILYNYTWRNRLEPLLALNEPQSKLIPSHSSPNKIDMQHQHKLSFMGWGKDVPRPFYFILLLPHPLNPDSRSSTSLIARAICSSAYRWAATVYLAERVISLATNLCSFPLYVFHLHIQPRSFFFFYFDTSHS